MRLRSDGAEVVVDPGRGGRLASLVVDGLELLAGDPSTGVYGWGCFPMVPWAGRVREGRFRFDGTAVVLPLGMPPHAIHGVGADRAWERTGPTEIAADLGEPWPFGGRVRQRFELDGGRLRVDLTVEAGDRPMPVVVGWHPWFRRRIGSGDPLELGFRPEAMLERDPAGIPSGALVDPPDRPWDDCFVGVVQPVVLVWPGALRLELRSSCDHWVVYDEPEHALCVEPQSAPPDAFNHEPPRIGAGEAIEHWFELSWRSRPVRSSR